MKENVKTKGEGGRASPSTRVSAKHQVTIPIAAFREAGLEVGDALRAEAIGPGRVVLVRQDTLLDEHSGTLHTGGELRRAVEGLRDEWT